MKKKLLFLTDLNFIAKGRPFYGGEDVFLTGRLREVFDLAICNLSCAQAFEDDADLIVVRNMGATSFIKEDYLDFRKRVNEKRLKVFNEFNGIGDQIGKQYLVDFTAAGYEVIPSVDRLEDISKLGDIEKYCIKPKNGADSNGLEFLTRDELLHKQLQDGEYIIQPWIDFEYEASFYFINEKFEYALYAPDKNRRWELVPYVSSSDDIAYAQKIISLSPVKNGIQRVDVCRTKDGHLLLMELEDLDPYLSLELLPEEIREQFVADMIAALQEMLY